MANFFVSPEMKCLSKNLHFKNKFNFFTSDTIDPKENYAFKTLMQDAFLAHNKMHCI